MATIITRVGKGSPLTNAEVDANFTNLNSELATKADSSLLASYQPLDSDLSAIAGLSGNTGILRKTGANAWALDTSAYLTSFTETDPVFSASPAAGITGTNISNWNTAYGWGNHASAGYLTTSAAAAAYQPLDADLTSIAGLAGTSGILRKTAANTWSLDTNTYLTSYTETDPTVGSHIKAITTTNISNWNTAFGWGNHASAGYLTGITSGQVTTALGYTPANRAGDTFTGAVQSPDFRAGTGSIFYLTGDQFLVRTTGGTQRLGIDGSGSVTANVDVRAPIFYDSANTGFYADPAGTSNFNGLNVNGGDVYRSSWVAGFQSLSDFANGTLVATDIPANISDGDSFLIEITGKSYSASNPPFKVLAQGYIYANQIISISGISYGGSFASYIKVFEDGGVLKFWWPTISYWNSFEVRVLAMNGPTNGNITRNRVTGITNSTEPTGTKKVQINLARNMRADISATNSVDLRAPIFYDSANTAYYVDPTGSTSINVAGNILAAGNVELANGSNRRIRLGSATNYNYDLTTNGDNFQIVEAGTTPRLTISYPSGAITASTDFRAPIFYDSNNTGYYLDPASTSALNIVNTAGYIQTYSGGVKWDESGVRSWSMYPSGGGMYVQSGDGGGALYANLSGGIRSYIFYDSDNTSYYIDPTGNTVLNTLWLRTGSSQSKFAYPSNFGYSSSYKTVVLGNEYLTTISMGVDVSGNASGSFNGQGEGREVIFRNGVQFITPNAANNSYIAPFGMVDGYAYSAGSFRAPIFYDTDNTGYYVNPAGTSNLASITLADTITIAGIYGRSAAGIGYLSGGYNGAETNSTTGPIYCISTGYAPTSTTLGSMYGIGYTDGGGSGVWSGGGWGMYAAAGGVARVFLDAANGIVYSTASVRSPIFYDSNNTAFYVDPNSGSRMSAITLDSGDVIGAASMFNNMNQPHTTQTDFNAVTNFGVRYLQGATNGPAIPSATQYYGFTLGLGSDYAYSSYASQLYWPRTPVGGLPYISVRFRENGPWGAWSKIYAGWADAPSGSTFAATGDFRAPIFYDSNNTAYYIDGASTSVLNTLMAAGGVGLYDSNNDPYGKLSVTRSSGANYTYLGFTRSGQTAIGMGIDTSNTFWIGSSSAGYDGVRTGTALSISAGGIVTATTDIRAPIFYDSNDTNYYLDPNGTSRTWKMVSRRFTNLEDVSADNAFGVFFSNNESTAYAIYREAGAWDYPYPDLRIAFHTGIKMGANASYQGIRFYTDYDMSAQVMSINNGSDPLGGGNVYVNQNLQAGISLRAPLFYDSNNTGFYVDPASTSNINQLNANGKIVLETSDSFLRINQYNGFSSGIWMGPSNIGGSGELHLGSNGTPSTARVRVIGGTYNGSNAIVLDGSNGNITTTGEAIIPTGRFRKNQTAGTYTTAALWTESFGSTPTGIAFHISGIIGKFLEMRTDGVLYWNGTLNAETDLRAPIFYDRDNTGYYLNPNGNSVLTTVETTGGNGVRAFANGSSSMVSQIYFGNVANNRAWNWQLDENNFAALWNYNGSAWSKRVTINESGNITAVGNVTAYSDIRIKDNVDTIPDALAKLSAIRGVTYTRTDLDDKDRVYAGVIAQEIEQVLPEAVREVGEVKAVDYNATIALLIQAVKELNAKVWNLEAELATK